MTAAGQTFDFDFRPSRRSQPTATKRVRVGNQTLETTPVFSAYWRFAAERQQIFFRRLSNTKLPLTDDHVLSRFKFTNSYRASDRVSQFLIRRVIYRDDLPTDATNVFFRVLLFKLFNKIETWTALEQSFGELTWETYDFRAYDRLLSARMADSIRIYSAAYIMPSAGSAFGHKLKHQNHLRLIEALIDRGYPSLASDCAAMSDLYDLLLRAPSIGRFLAYQFATDLNYSCLTNFDESEFVVAGPGALDGIEKCFVGARSVEPEDVIRYMYENQHRHFSEEGIDFRSLWGRPLQLIDCQNVFCEISKYARVAFPEYTGIAGRTRIKQKFQPTATPLTPWYPPKWGINDSVEQSLRSDVAGVTKRRSRATRPIGAN